MHDNRLQWQTSSKMGSRVDLTKHIRAWSDSSNQDI